MHFNLGNFDNSLFMGHEEGYIIIDLHEVEMIRLTIDKAIEGGTVFLHFKSKAVQSFVTHNKTVFEKFIEDYKRLCGVSK